MDDRTVQAVGTEDILLSRLKEALDKRISKCQKCIPFKTIEDYFDGPRTLPSLVEITKIGLPIDGEISECLTQVYAILEKSEPDIAKAWLVTVTNLTEAIQARLILEEKLKQEISALGLPQHVVDNFFSRPRTAHTLQKILDQGLPSYTCSDHPELTFINPGKCPKHKIGGELCNADLVPAIPQWSAMPKTLDTLRKIKHPLLCNWSVAEILDAMRPYVWKQIKAYKTTKHDFDDCMQQGNIGLLNAIRTDAGISPFADHCFAHIRTNIRRASATSGVIKDSERRPSKTDVRREITIWMSGRWLAAKQDQLARDCPSTIRPTSRARRLEEIDPKLVAKVKLDAERQYAARIARCPVNQVNILRPQDLEFSDIQVIGIGLKAASLKWGWMSIDVATSGFNAAALAPKVAIEIGRQYEINIITLKGGKVATGFLASVKGELITIEDEFGNQNELQVADIIKVAIRGRELLVKNSYKLSTLSKTEQCDLLEYLTVRFTDPEANIVAPTPGSELQTVADVVKEFATNPDFQGNPLGLDMQVDTEGVSLASAIPGANLERVNKSGAEYKPAIEGAHVRGLKSLVAKVLNDLIRTGAFTEKQAMVFCHVHGLNGFEQLDHSEVAKKMGVSNTRILQFLDITTKKLREAIFTEIFSKPNSKHLMIETIKEAKLCTEDRLLLEFYYGLQKFIPSFYAISSTRQRTLDEIAQDYERLTYADPLPEHWQLPQRRAYVKEKLAQVKDELVKYMI